MNRFLMLFLLGFAATAHAAPNFSFAAPPGPYEAGWRVVQQYDYTRLYRSEVDLLTGKATQAERVRPIQTLIWYPAQAGGKASTYADYALTAAADDDFTLGMKERRHAMNELIKAEAPGIEQSRIETELGQAMRAVRDAEPAAGKFPVVIYAPSFSAPAMENADLCEYLASAGYIVIASPSVGNRTRDMSKDIEGIETQAADIRYLIGYAHTLEHADPSHLAVMGYSWGGIANVFAAAQDDRIKALISLDGSVRYFPTLVNTAKYVTPEKLPLPFLFLAARPHPIEDLVRYKIDVSDSLIDKMVYSDTYVVTLRSMTHGDFASLSLRFNGDGEYTEYTRAEAASGYNWMARYALHFLDAYLKNDKSGAAFLQADPVDNGAPAHMLSATFHPSAGAPPSLSRLAQLATEQGYGKLPQAMKTLDRQKPGYKPSDKELMDWAARLQGAAREADALEVLKLNADLHPDNFINFHALGDAYERNGDKAHAIEAYRHTVELEPADTDAAQRVTQLEAESH
jgi:dienelactone hydrolase